MKTIAKTLAAVAIVGASATSAQAWWGPWGNSGYGGGPWSGLGDMFGDVDANFSSRGWGRGSGYGYPYAGGTGYGYPYAAPYGYGVPYGVPYGAVPPAVVAPVAPAAPAAAPSK